MSFQLNAEDHSYKVSYVDLLLHIKSSSNYLHSIGFSHGDIASVLLPNCWEYFVIYFSILMRGGCISGFNPLSSDCKF
jgi:acyl-CoA synthetase (AMP-forming)/AMP-acid ligase II